MVDLYQGKIPIIRRKLDEGWINPPEPVRAGYEERDYSKYPQTMFASPDEMKLIPESELDARYDEQEATESSLLHLFLKGGKPAFKNLDQNGDGYCWGYSSAHGVMLQRLAMGLPLVRLNPHSICAIIKKGKDAGGWGGQSAEFITEHGCGVEGNGPGQWPLHSRSLKYNTPELRADMEKYKITDQWVDLTQQVYDRNLTKKQIWTSCFNNQPGPRDYNRFGHSMCGGLGWVRIERGHWGEVILNSWRNYGYHGLIVLAEEIAVPNGALSIRSVTIS